MPDSDSLQTDICGPGYRYMSDGRLVLESKDEMKKRGMQSPDEGDAVALCFSEPGGLPWSPTATSIGRSCIPMRGSFERTTYSRQTRT